MHLEHRDGRRWISKVCCRCYFGRCSGILAIAGENKYLVIVLIFFPIVGHGYHPELRRKKSRSLSNPLAARETSVEYLFYILPILKPSIDRQQHVEHGSDGNGEVDGFVFADASIGEYVVPVHGLRQYQEAASEGCEMGRQAVRLR